MPKPIITIGMAHYNDFKGLYGTIQAIRSMHLYEEWFEQLQFVVVDQSPAESKHSPLAEGLMRNLSRSSDFLSGKYISLPHPKGTSPPRNAIFEHADSDYVLVIDSHVTFTSKTLPAILKWYKEHPAADGIYTGPIMMDNMHEICPTHMAAMWREKMWGIWAVAWRAPGGEVFQILNVDGKAKPFTMEMAHEPMTIESFPDISFAGHEKVLWNAGYRPLSTESEPFAIPGQGCGFFSCRKDAWLGFHPLSRGFGGEELYIQEKFRQAGREVLCLPEAKWGHRFGDPDPKGYPNVIEDRVRNYVLEFQELNLDVEPIYHHFSQEIPQHERISEAVWKKILSDPAGFNQQGKRLSCSTCGTQATGKPWQEIWETALKTPRDLNEHMETLKSYADKCDSIMEITERQESTIAFLTSSAKKLISFQREQGKFIKDGMTNFPDRFFNYSINEDISLVLKDESYDLAFLDAGHTYREVVSQLQNFGVRAKRFIILHDTTLYGSKGPDNQAGKMKAISEFLKSNPLWTIIRQDHHQHGLTVLGCHNKDRPPLPSIAEMGWNFAKATAKDIANGRKRVTPEVYEHRMEKCRTCPLRVKDPKGVDRCSDCGCPLEAKLTYASERCPIEPPRWSKEV